MAVDIRHGTAAAASYSFLAQLWVSRSGEGLRSEAPPDLLIRVKLATVLLLKRAGTGPLFETVALEIYRAAGPRRYPYREGSWLFA